MRESRKDRHTKKLRLSGLGFWLGKQQHPDVQLVYYLRVEQRGGVIAYK